MVGNAAALVAIRAALPVENKEKANEDGECRLVALAHFHEASHLVGAEHVVKEKPPSHARECEQANPHHRVLQLARDRASQHIVGPIVARLAEIHAPMQIGTRGGGVAFVGHRYHLRHRDAMGGSG